ncbi:type III restriction enzyme [Loa loa]|uniref:RNA helicase n=1 Tax=Loa loa TaxID=7209 RepID=A0A1S0U6Q1_LOALO|nr:type III restriction enzyme [Loa loa]EFO26157.1 type III restriction enzyme [Loa loa]
MDKSFQQNLSDDEFSKLMISDEGFRLGHLRLYKAELLESVDTVEKLQQFRQFFDDPRCFARLLDLFKDDSNKKMALNYFWRRIRFNREAMDRILFMATKDNKALLDLIHESIPARSLEFYRKMFYEDTKRMDKITTTIEPLPICAKLKDVGYESIKNVVREMMKTKKYEEAACYLMRSLPKVGSLESQPSSWYFDFLNACLVDSANRSIPEFIDPDYKIHLDAYNTQCRILKISQNKSGLQNELPNTVKELEEPEKPESRTQEHYKKYRMKAFSDEKLERLEDAESIELRPYQQELVATACRGVNTIICAPTGSGKTVVAAHIILEHFRTMKAADKPSRVAILVPTIPLVEQQCIMLNRYLRKTFWVDGMSGSEPVDENGRAPNVLASHVTVFTPQIFINLLRSIRRDDRLYFTDFSMFIFDECHHCDGDHPYHVLMRMLHRFDGPKPQIVGLTASLPLGAGRANVEAALDHMMDLCAKLSAHSISTVRKHMENLRYFVKPPVDDIKRAHRPEYDSFCQSLEICMRKIEFAAKPELEKIAENKVINFRVEETAFPVQKSSMRYENFVGGLKNRLAELPGGKVKHQLIKMLEHLGYYYRALCLSDLLPNWYAYSYLRENMAKEIFPDRRDSTTIQNQLKKLFEKFVKPNELNFKESDSGEEKEILKMLHTILREQYVSDPASRTIIFVTTRRLAQYLSHHLNTVKIVDGTNRAVGFVTSSNRSSALSGQTAEEQRTVIENFNQGTLKVLVATSVAEEGLDISACNLIIKYNNTGSERSLIQRRGRARARHSRSILLALDGSIEEKELENIQKEHLMRRCLEHMQTKSENQMKQLVETKINQMRALHEANLVRENEKKRSLEGKCYDLKCRLCGAFICKSSSMRIACDSQYVCCDPTIWERINARVHSAKSLAIATLVGKPHCKGNNESDCNEVLGTIVKLYGAFLPTIAAKAIIVDDSEGLSGRPQCEKKWDSITADKFCVEPITESDLKVMLNSLYNYSRQQHLQFEAEAGLAVKRALTEMKKEKRPFAIQE